jgi:hypothetical protein
MGVLRSGDDRRVASSAATRNDHRADHLKRSWPGGVHKSAGSHGGLPALTVLMDAAIAELQRAFLDDAQIASSRAIMGIDTELIDDGTYFVVESDGDIAGCGGWSRRATLYGGNQTPGRDSHYGAHARGHCRQPDGLCPAEGGTLAERDHGALHPCCSSALSWGSGAWRGANFLAHGRARNDHRLAPWRRPGARSGPDYPQNAHARLQDTRIRSVAT